MPIVLTSRISNLSVLTLFQVFFSLATGLMFIPAGHRERVSKCRALTGSDRANELYVWHQILTDDGHERVEVSNVETLLSNIDEELYDPRSVFLLHRLK